MIGQPSYGLRAIYRKLTIEALEKFPDAETRTIARYLFYNYPTVFLSIETARDKVRYFRGTAGNSNRKKLKDKTYVIDKSI